MKSIFAGLFIGFGAIINLSIGGLAGAIFFSLGLMTIIAFKFELFTGKAGLYAINEISLGKLIEIWFGNFAGTFIAVAMVLLTKRGRDIAVLAQPIVETRLGNTVIENIILGILCGILMFVAVEGYAKTKNILFVIMPVASFIMCGFNHCVADMAYVHLGAMTLGDYQVLIPTTIGNFIGCNLINWCI